MQRYMEILRRQDWLSLLLFALILLTAFHPSVDTLPLRQRAGARTRAREGSVSPKCCAGASQVDERPARSRTRDAAQHRNFPRCRHLLGVLFWAHACHRQETTHWLIDRAPSPRRGKLPPLRRRAAGPRPHRSALAPADAAGARH